MRDLEVGSGVERAGHLVDHRAGSEQHGQTVGEHALHELLVGQAVGADPPLGGEGGHLVDEPLGGTEATGADHEALEAEPLVDERHPGVLRPDQLGGRDAYVLELHDRVVVGDGVGVRRGADDADARRVLVGHEQRLLAGVVTGGQDRLEEHVVGLVVRRDVPLHAVQDVVVPVAGSGRPQVGDVSQGLRGWRLIVVAVAAAPGRMAQHRDRVNVTQVLRSTPPATDPAINQRRAVIMRHPIPNRKLSMRGFAGHWCVYQ